MVFILKPNIDINFIIAIQYDTNINTLTGK